MVPSSIAAVATSEKASGFPARVTARHAAVARHALVALTATAPECSVEAAEVAPARPLWFGEASAPLFGWFHPAAGDELVDAVVVLCNPFGYDALCTHYAHQKLAEHLAGAGVAAFRFDYEGTGDSAGDDEGGANRIATWLANIGAAVDEAKRRSGASKVVLFGVRLGALLATAYAQRAPVDGLVAMGPSRSGAVFVREVLAMNKMRAATPNPAASPDLVYSDDESLGFSFSPALRAEIATLDPRKSDVLPAPRALVIARDDIPGPEKALVEHLRALGGEVACSSAPGYADLFADSKGLPVETADEILNWIRAASFGTRAPSAPEAPEMSGAAPVRAAVDGVIEEAVRFDGLFGMWTEPPAGTPRRQTAIVVLGAGATHHVGTNRMWTPFARRMAKEGYCVLRFDLSGIGESPTVAGERDRGIYTPRAIPETRKAVDYAVRRGAKRVAMTGLCSGGYTSFHTAAVDPRVVAIAPVNTPVYHFNAGDSLVLAKNRPAVPWRPAPIRVRPSHAWRRAKLAFPAPALFLAPTDVKPAVLPRTGALVEDTDDVARAFGGIVTRGAKVLFVYGSADPGRHALERHLGVDLAKAKGEPGIEMVLLDGCDHTVTPKLAQRRMHDHVCEFFLRTCAE